MEENVAEASKILESIIANVERVIIGKRKTIELALVSIISGGHVLIEDVPGTGKTSLVSSFARSIDCSFKRIQFTPDVMPSDITGFSMYNPKTSSFEYKKGAVLNQFVQADEINRTSSKTQAALLEVMEEQQVTVDGVTYNAPKPFIVFATQNPMEYVGTYQLPEAQLDRFFMCISLGYPSNENEKNIILNRKNDRPDTLLKPVASADDILNIQASIDGIHLSPEVADYIIKLTASTRFHPDISLGASPRGSLHLCKAAKAWALMQGRSYVIPDDVQQMALPVLNHRMFIKRASKLKGANIEDVLRDIISRTPVPVV